MTQKCIKVIFLVSDSQEGYRHVSEVYFSGICEKCIRIDCNEILFVLS